MLLKRALSSLLRTSYKNWKLFSLLLTIPILLHISILGFFNKKNSQLFYDKIVKEEKIIQESKKENPQQLAAATKEYAVLLKELSNCLLKYQLSLAHELPQEGLQAFQGKVEQDVGIINEKAKARHVILPASFFLGLNQYKRTLPSLENLALVTKQEVFLNWIANEIITQPNLVVNEFKLESKDSLIFSTNSCSAFSLGYAVLSITTNETAFQQIINNILTGPYCLLIKKLIVENSSKKSPPRSLKNNLLEKEQSNIKILFGREKITVVMILQLIEVRI
ncbi:MAG: hypothetical protein K2W99_02385 [Chthoniobacterales bacterium]|nr:hypothetical protein [Chthoniobacterales bacterium]